MIRAMVSAAIRDIEAIRATLSLDKRRHSEVVLRHLRHALDELPPPTVAVVVRLDLAARRARAVGCRLRT